MTVIICQSNFFVMHSVNLERCNIFKAKLFSGSPNTWRTAAACSVLKGGLLSVTWQMYLPEQSWLALLITRRWVPGLRIPDWGREMQAPPGGKVSTRSCDQSELSMRQADQWEPGVPESDRGRCGSTPSCWDTTWSSQCTRPGTRSRSTSGSPATRTGQCLQTVLCS